jgi:hypothetical protein
VPGFTCVSVVIVKTNYVIIVFNAFFMFYKNSFSFMLRHGKILKITKKKVLFHTTTNAGKKSVKTFNKLSN